MKFNFYIIIIKTKKLCIVKDIITILSFLICLILNSKIIKRKSEEEEIKNIELYLKLCSMPFSKGFEYFNKRKFPKVSIISPVYNRGKYLSRFLKSIYYQNFRDIEIILIDDFSSDDSVMLIKQFQNKDKRIILIKNNKNYGTFKSRNIGILMSSGKYVIIPDPDDILSQDSLKTLYSFANKYNYEMLRFNLYVGYKMIMLSYAINIIESRPIFQPELKTYLYYAMGRLRLVDFNISNKFIKREALIRALNLLGKDYLNIYMTTYEDQLLNFILYRTAKSFYLFKKIGYYYIINRHSITQAGFQLIDIKNIFIHLKIIFEFSKNNVFEKNMFNFHFTRFVKRKSVISHLNLIKNESKFFIEYIDLFIKSDLISVNNKAYMIKMKKKLLKFNSKKNRSISDL